MRAAVGVERTKQTMLMDRLGNGSGRWYDRLPSGSTA